MLSLKDITKDYNGRVAVDGISFEVTKGETLVLLGTSGCGKTTTLRMINRLEEPDTGEIRINDTLVKHLNIHELRRGIGYVIQNHGLFPHYTVAENISTVPNLLKWDKQKTNKAMDDLLLKLNLNPDIKQQFPGQLSGGQKQRVGLARALITQPPLLLMDEPFGALDAITRISIRKELKNLPDFQEKTIVMVTHDVQEAFEMADRICIMDQGKIIQIGTPEALLFDSSNAFIRQFLQDQRLQLELKAITVHDLQVFSATDWKDVRDSEHKQSLWDALEKSLTGKSSVGNIDPAKLIHSFLAYKNQVHE
ncbi:MAG: ABC transporter ATP-binding protein [Pedobacter sp.]|nr:MAG: ABC transporter ATP-binding protein [Pedobacter sp.]